MKFRVLRNALSVLVATVWLTTAPAPVTADSTQACDIYCSWTGGSCCNVGDLQCGSGGSGQGLCMYCQQSGGSQESTSCSVTVGEEELQGSVCQCESPGNQ